MVAQRLTVAQGARTQAAAAAALVLGAEAQSAQAVQVALVLSSFQSQQPTTPEQLQGRQRLQPVALAQFFNLTHREATRHDNPFKHPSSGKRIDGFRHTASGQRRHRTNFAGHCW